MKTVADLKRDAKSGKLFVEMIYRDGEIGKEIPERLKGIRQIISSNSNSITLLTVDNKKSTLWLPNANLVEYDDAYIKIYKVGTRNLTIEEQRFLEDWETEEESYPEYQDTYNIQKAHFIENNYEYLLGYEEKQGKRYSSYIKKVYDDKIKGDIELEYKIIYN